MGSQVPFMLASPNMEVKSQLLSLHSLESDLNNFMQKNHKTELGGGS